MGVKLFRRHGPKLTTTDRAKALGQRLEQALRLMGSAVDDCRRLEQPLRVTCAPTFAARWLVPRLATYHALTGADAIVLDNIQSVLPAGAFDAAIRSGVGPWPGYGAAKLITEQRTPMFSPKWAAGRLTAKMLLQMPLIPDPGWSAWFKLAGVANAKPRFVATRFPNYELEAQAAVQGVGAALLSPMLFADLRAQGALLAPFPWMIEGPASYWLLWGEEFSECHFVRWMKSQFGIGTDV